MRSETEIMNLILEIAREDPRIRAVMLNGSRSNPRVRPDCFQDYDIVYVVNELESFLLDPHWTDLFGEKMIQQLPDQTKTGRPKQRGKFVYLMQFTDGSRIDLTLLSCEQVEQRFQWDSLTQVLLDKDGRIPPLPEASDKDYVISPPDAYDFAACCKGFWWGSTYVAKGLWRWEITYVKAIMDGPVRDKLLRMLAWSVGSQDGFTVNIGEYGKFLEQSLEKPVWLRLLKTYPDAEREHIWKALFVMCDLFRQISHKVAEHFQFVYPQEDDNRVSAYLQQVHSLPDDAQDIPPLQSLQETQDLTVSKEKLLQFSAE